MSTTPTTQALANNTTNTSARVELSILKTGGMRFPQGHCLLPARLSYTGNQTFFLTAIAFRWAGTETLIKRYSRVQLRGFLPKFRLRPGETLEGKLPVPGILGQRILIVAEGYESAPKPLTAAQKKAKAQYNFSFHALSGKTEFNLKDAANFPLRFVPLPKTRTPPKAYREKQKRYWKLRQQKMASDWKNLSPQDRKKQAAILKYKIMHGK